MQFVKHGPDVPERLLEAHEEGRVVFFCGAGISKPAELKDFGELVKTLYENLGVTPNRVQRAALKAHQYDTAVGLLENDHPGGRSAVRKELAAILSPSDTSTKAVATHEALLTLGKTRDGKLRLVTTNFDRLFETVIARKEPKVATFEAPRLPVPKNHWNGLVYLHGLLPETPETEALDRLVVSSGDFGLAYLTERWAARFVSELFRNYTVCFVGYSLNDPVLRYMMDALAADRQRGEAPCEMFAFADHQRGEESDCEAEWRAKNVTPILYWHARGHRYLHETLRRWSEVYRDGVRGKEQIILKEASASPRIVTRQDDFVGRVLWALSDQSGQPAKHFAELNPVPSLDWLVPLSEDRYGHEDLTRYGVPPKAEQDDKLRFSLVRRPAPYTHAPPMCLFDTGASGSDWDEVMHQLARWLVRHLGDPKLVLWLARSGERLHEDLARRIDRRLSELTKLEREKRIAELNDILAGAPKAVPSPALRTVWRLFLSERIKPRSSALELGLYDWRERLERDGLTPSVRLALRNLLAPCIELRAPIREHTPEDEAEAAQRVRDIVDWELKLRTDHVHGALRAISSSTQWQDALPELLPDVHLLLRDALDLLRELGSADERSDLSYLHQPSITPHEQNRDYRDWTALIELTRDAWLALAKSSRRQARQVAEQWRLEPYPLFTRLAFFAAAQEEIVPSRLAVDWLLSENGWWLWSVETQREALRLLVALAPRLRPADLGRVERAVLAGPPRDMFKNDLQPEEWERIVGRGVWLRLAKMAAGGATLSAETRAELDRLSEKYPQWRLADDESDEFPFWMGEGDEWRTFIATPREKAELVEWLKRHPKDELWQEDDWRQRCREDFEATSWALLALAQEGEWLPDRWRAALQAWTDERLLARSWRHIGPALANAPEEVVEALAHSLSRWLQTLARPPQGQQELLLQGRQELFLRLCQRILHLDYPDEDAFDDPVTTAINHPVGQVTEALLRWWYRDGLDDNQGLSERIEPILTELCDSRRAAHRHARVILAEHVIALLRVDAEWTQHNLLPHFDWQRSALDAKAVWSGFLSSPRLYPPLLELIKQPFLDTARHYEELGEYGRQYAAFLTFAALEMRGELTAKALRSATEALPMRGLCDAAESLVRALESAGERRADYWRNRVLPYWRSVWPQSKHYRTPEIAESLARLCVAAGEAFPDALQTLRHWLLPLEYSERVVRPLHEQGLAEHFPEFALEMLDAVVDRNAPGPVPPSLKECLVDIRTKQANLAEDERFRRLREYLRRHGEELP